MRPILTLILCTLGLHLGMAQAQTTNIDSLRADAGTVLTFYLQTRLDSGSGNALDALPRGTQLRVKLLDSIDSHVDRDGAEFRGALIAPVISKDNDVVVHAEAEVHGLLALLRSRNHPEGFRYELLITSVTEKGKSYELTASLNPSFADGSKPRTGTVDPSNGQAGKGATAGSIKPQDVHK